MIRHNIFDGEGYAALFANIIYKFLKTREWFSNADVMAVFLGLGSAEELPCPISKCDHIKELTKALLDIREAIGDSNFDIDGNNRNKKYRYIGDDVPLKNMRNAKVVKDLRKYWHFCQDSAGFFPTSWLEYFFKDCQDLLDIKTRQQKGEQVLSASLDRMLTNIELLPMLYQAIVGKQVLLIDYKPYEKELQTLTFHPHFLKEFNGRWHLFGHAEEKQADYPEYGHDIALDRIVGKPREVYNINYLSAPAGFYTAFFKDIVGVSHKSGAKVEDIRIRAHSLNIFKLTETKKIHDSQETTISYGLHEDGEYGEFIVRLEVNKEFIGTILHYGAGLEVVGPEEVRKEFRDIVTELYHFYEDDINE